MKSSFDPVAATDLEWVKSSYSGTNGNCVEVAALPAGGRALRDSKRADSPMLVFTPEGWNAFAAGIAGDDLKHS